VILRYQFNAKDRFPFALLRSPWILIPVLSAYNSRLMMNSYLWLYLPVTIDLVIIDFLFLIIQSILAIFFHFISNLLYCFAIGFEFFRFVSYMIFAKWILIDLKLFSDFFSIIHSLSLSVSIISIVLQISI